MKTPSHHIAESRVSSTRMFGPSDANHHNVVHGGIVMKEMDEIGALAAMRHARKPVVTVAIDSMSFVKPIYINSIVLLGAELTYVGRSSMETRVEVHTEEISGGEMELKITAFLVYVALDNQTGKPTTVPRLQYENEEQIARAERARLRQQFRLEQRRLEENP